MSETTNIYFDPSPFGSWHLVMDGCYIGCFYSKSDAYAFAQRDL